MDNQFARTEILIKEEGLQKLMQAKVAVFGIGGVGSFVCEALVRAGVGTLTLIDNDVVDITNLNRQIHALHSTIGQEKIEVMKKRILDINPNVKVEIVKEFYLPENNNKVIDETFSYVVDAVDTVSAKIEIVINSKKANVPVISSMGTGNKLNPTMLEVTDIYKTSVCPLAKVMRKELKQRGVDSLKVVYSKEEPIKQDEKVLENIQNSETKKTPGSISFVPSVAGLIIASEVVKDLIK